MKPPEPTAVETDPRFPSGKWLGFFLDARVPGRHEMELELTFRNGEMTGEGRDRVGEFTIRGKYDIDDGQCHWIKHYTGQHDVFYKGFNEGKGIWGTWELPGWKITGGFHIWPEGMPDPTQTKLSEEADPPRLFHFDDEPSCAEELVPVTTDLSAEKAIRR